MNTCMNELRACGCDIKGAMDRFLWDEDLYMDCLGQALQDPAFDRLGTALQMKKTDDAFDAAHILKGVLGNMGLTPLYQIDLKIVEPLRTGVCDGLDQLYDQLLYEREKVERIYSH